MFTWSDSMGRVVIRMTMQQAIDCDALENCSVGDPALVIERLKEQLDDSDETKIRAVLRDCGFQPLKDGDNLALLVWVAARDIRDTPNKFRS